MENLLKQSNISVAKILRNSLVPLSGYENNVEKYFVSEPIDSADPGRRSLRQTGKQLCT